jgi:hypothetical protein
MPPLSFNPGRSPTRLHCRTLCSLPSLHDYSLYNQWVLSLSHLSSFLPFCNKEAWKSSIHIFFPAPKFSQAFQHFPHKIFAQNHQEIVPMPDFHIIFLSSVSDLADHGLANWTILKWRVCGLIQNSHFMILPRKLLSLLGAWRRGILWVTAECLLLCLWLGKNLG